MMMQSSSLVRGVGSGYETSRRGGGGGGGGQSLGNSRVKFANLVLWSRSLGMGTGQKL